MTDDQLLIKELIRKLIDKNSDTDLSYIEDINVLTGVLKEFLSFLQDPIIPRSYWNSLTSAAKNGELESVTEMVLIFPEANLSFLRFLLGHFHRLEQEKENKMTIEGLATAVWIQNLWKFQV